MRATVWPASQPASVCRRHRHTAGPGCGRTCGFSFPHPLTRTRVHTSTHTHAHTDSFIPHRVSSPVGEVLVGWGKVREREEGVPRADGRRQMAGGSAQRGGVATDEQGRWPRSSDTRSQPACDAWHGVESRPTQGRGAAARFLNIPHHHPRRSRKDEAGDCTDGRHAVHFRRLGTRLGGG